MSIKIKPSVTIMDFERGRRAERERIINYLTEKGILRESIFGNSLVATMNDKPADGSWHIIDLPKDLGANE